MPSQTQSLDATALTLILFLAIHLYVRMTVVWMESLSNRYAERAARQAKAAPTDGDWAARGNDSSPRWRHVRVTPISNRKRRK